MTNKSKIVDGIRYVQCGTCKKYMPLFSFYRLKHGRYGVKSECKECSRMRLMKWIENNHSKYLEYLRANYEKRYRNDPSFREKVKQRSREFRQKNPWYNRELQRKFREKNPDYYKKLRQMKTA